MIQGSRPTEYFTPISNDIFRDTRLNLTDRGLLTTLMSLPVTWDFSVEGMVAILPDGRDRVTSSLKRLVKLGYITIIQERDEKGKFLKNHVTINGMDISPHTENPITENPQTDERSTEKHTQYNNSNDTKIKNINSKREPDTLPPKEYEELIKEYGKNAVDSQIAKIHERHYTGCMNKETIGTWCRERRSREERRKLPQTSFSNFHQRKYSPEYYKDLEAKLLGIPLNKSKVKTE